MFFDSVEKINERVAFWLDSCRKQGRSQKEIAAKSGIDSGNLSGIKNGTRQLSMSSLRGLALAMDIYPSDLLPVTWIRSDTKIDIDRIEKAFQVVIESYAETIKEHGEDFISTEDLAKIAAILVEDKDIEFNRKTLKHNIKIANKLNNRHFS